MPAADRVDGDADREEQPGRPGTSARRQPRPGLEHERREDLLRAVRLPPRGARRRAQALPLALCDVSTSIAASEAAVKVHIYFWSYVALASQLPVTIYTH